MACRRLQREVQAWHARDERTHDATAVYPSRSLQMHAGPIIIVY